MNTGAFGRRMEITSLKHCLSVEFFQRNGMMVVIKFKKDHGLSAGGTLQRVVTEREKQALPPFVEGKKDTVLFL